MKRMKLILLEMPWFGTDIAIPTISGKSVTIDRIDLRIEDMKRYGGFVPKDFYNWLAPLPSGQFLTHDHGVIDAARAQGLGWQELPADWWHYALGTKDGIIVKAPKHPRPGEPTQEEVDAKGGIPQESYERRLSRCLT